MAFRNKLYFQEKDILKQLELNNKYQNVVVTLSCVIKANGFNLSSRTLFNNVCLCNYVGFYSYHYLIYVISPTLSLCM